MTNTRSEKVANGNPSAMVSIPSTSPKEATANQHTGKARPSTSSPQDMTTATRTDRDLKGDHMTTIRPPHRDTYICAYREELLRLFGNRTRVYGHDVDDIVSYAVELVMEQIDFIYGKYPDPVVFARRQYTNKIHDYRRRIASQRGEGARFSRAIDSFDMMSNPDASVPGVIDFSDSVVESMERDEQMGRLRDVLSDKEMEIVWLVDGHDMTVKDAAKRLGLRRETVSRKRTAIHEKANKTLGPAA